MSKIKWTPAPKKAVKPTYNGKARKITKGVSKSNKKPCK